MRLPLPARRRAARRDDPLAGTWRPTAGAVARRGPGHGARLLGALAPLLLAASSAGARTGLARFGGTGTGGTGAGPGAACPWTTPGAGQSDTGLAAEVVSRMSLAQQLDVVTLRSTKGYENSTTAVPSLCIPALTMQDGPDGLAYRDAGVTQFPAALGLAATFDPALATAEGRAIGTQAKAQGVGAVQGPYLNLARVPEAGRVFEGYGEDPLLSGAMGAADVRGLQSAGVLADVKDYGVYTQETGRVFLDQVVSEQALHELYLAPFEAVVRQGKAASVMCGFGKVNGVETCEDPALLGELRSWGFGGFVRDDINGAPDASAALAAGLDLFKPAPWSGSGPALGPAQRVAVAAAARRVLGQMFRFGLVQHPLTGKTSTPVQTAGAQAVGQAVAEEGAVLLKDQGGALPIAAPVPSIAVIGTAASSAPISSGRGSSAVGSPSVTTPLAGLVARWPHARVTFTPGEPVGAPAGEIASSAVTPALPVPPPPPAHPIYHTASPPKGVWRTWNGVLRAPATGLYELSVVSHGDTDLSVGGTRLLSDPGTHGPVLDQVAYPFVAGRPYRVTLHWFAYDGNVPRLAWQDATPMIAAAARAAASAAVAVVVAGNESTEGADNPSLSLPGVQDALIAAVAHANPRTVVVLDTGGAVLMPWLSSVAAVLEAWYPGQSDGTALAAVLSGAVDPSGHLPVTFPASAAATSVPTAASWPGIANTVDLNAAGGGGLDVGYRYYQAHHVGALFPFGYGLSYTTFALSGLAVTPSPGVRGGYVVRATATDTGPVAGRAVVQVYVGYPSAARQPPLALQAFASVDLRPGQRSVVTMDLPPRAFETWQRGGFATVPGTYRVEVGTSSADLPLATTLALG